ncbi:hypothetical protein FB567DRAFT_585654 [Paraphoma chrysanthemicola]|uniref:Apple domain-containing protein n=1 Tax=Paraphoma chrysanthemicola TaxID=798071 RepID=A0A8K0W3V2_9PLEO|nr:hypothetical protein FB567DRAFT_585654 [Paraphoma chrysanthemicola]
MHSSTTIFVASTLLSAVSGSPLSLRANTCGTTPTGGTTNNQPIQQPTGIQTAADCQAKCNATSTCQSFSFGLVDNTIKCNLFSVPASSVPKQSSANLVVYDKACAAVPSVVPTSSNPTGKAQDNQQQQSGSGNTRTESGDANTKPVVKQRSTTENNSGANQQPEPAKVSETPTKPKQATPTPTPSKQPQQDQTQRPQKQISSLANTCGSKPTANTTNQPLSQPSVTSIAACKAECQANGNCKSFTFGTVDDAKVCKLFSVAASEVPATTDGVQKEDVGAFDVGCGV